MSVITCLDFPGFSAHKIVYEHFFENFYFCLQLFIMNIEELRDFALSLKDVTEGFPFGEDTLVFKINGKVFLLTSLTASPLNFNVKCDPDEAVELRERYSCVLPGYHMNKKHWNTILADGTFTKNQLQELIAESYALVLKKKR